MLEEALPANGAKVVLLVQENGDLTAIGGDRVPGEGDTPYIGLERLMKRLKEIRDTAKRECEMIRAGDVVQLRSGGQSMTVVRSGFSFTTGIGLLAECSFFDGSGVCQWKIFPECCLIHAGKNDQ